MLEIIMMGVCVVGMFRVAENDNESGILWGGVTALLCILGVMFVPLPYARELIAFGLAFLLLIAYKVLRK